MKLLENYWIGKNEPCPCGSGKKYKDCCKGRDNQASLDMDRSLDGQLLELLRKPVAKSCIHPDQASCRGMVRNSRPLQPERVMNLLSGADKQVYVMDRDVEPRVIKFEDDEPIVLTDFVAVPAKNAVTEAFFCERHAPLFSILGKGEFDPENQEEQFLYAYRAFATEYNKQTITLRSFQRNFKLRPFLFRLPRLITLYRATLRALEDLEAVKTVLDRALISGKHGGLVTYVVTIPRTIGFANYAFRAPDYDMNGEKILHTAKNGPTRRLAMTAFPEKGQSYLLLSCLEEDLEVYESLFRQLDRASPEKTRFYFSRILPLYAENMVLSPRLWEAWSEETRLAFTIYANFKANLKSNFKEWMFDHYSEDIGRSLWEAANGKKPFDYSQGPLVDLFAV